MIAWLLKGVFVHAPGELEKPKFVETCDATTALGIAAARPLAGVACGVPAVAAAEVPPAGATAAEGPSVWL